MAPVTSNLLRSADVARLWHVSRACVAYRYKTGKLAATAYTPKRDPLFSPETVASAEKPRTYVAALSGPQDPGWPMNVKITEAEKR